MDLFIPIYIIVVFVLGYFLMSKQDLFKESPKFLVDVNGTFGTQKSYILIFGYSDLTKELIDILMHQKMDFLVIDAEDQLDKSMTYTHLYAISDNDYSNLVISLIAKKSLGVNQIVAICNSFDNKPIFDQNKIQFLQMDENVAEHLYLTFFPAVNTVNHYDK